MMYENIDQDIVRDKFKNYLANSGVKLKFVAEKCNVSSALLSLFKNDRQDLGLNTLKVLNNYLDYKV